MSGPLSRSPLRRIEANWFTAPLHGLRSSRYHPQRRALEPPPLLNGVFLGYVEGEQWAGMSKAPIDISTLERFERFEV
jgi:hypothetical protein